MTIAEIKYNDDINILIIIIVVVVLVVVMGYIIVMPLYQMSFTNIPLADHNRSDIAPLLRFLRRMEEKIKYLTDKIYLFFICL